MEKIKSLINDRIIEATKEQISQKMFLIAKYLGRPIVWQGTYHDYDPWQTDEDFVYDPIDMPIQDVEDWETAERGYYFDGLKCGVNLCITVLTYDDKVSEMKATYNGYLIFMESEGEIRAYAPFPAWRNHLSMFHEAAVSVEKKKLLAKRELKKEENKQKVNSFWQKFRTLWGY